MEDEDKIKKLTLEGYKELRENDSIFNKFINKNPELEKLFSLENFEKFIKSEKFQFLYIQQVIKGSVETAGIKGLIKHVETIDESQREVVKHMVTMKKQLNLIEDYLKNIKPPDGDDSNGLFT